eukprot:m.17735 g.17735  ORF g.17735 m.17735 type:complete len:445 (+) comp6095_c0_seq1:156-1490(+)
MRALVVLLLLSIIVFAQDCIAGNVCGGTDCRQLRCPSSPCSTNSSYLWGCTGYAYEFGNGNCSCVTPQKACPSDNSWQDDVKNALENSNLNGAYFIVGGLDEEYFAYKKGFVQKTTNFASASSIKWVSAAVILKVVEDGKMNLSDNPQKFLSWWTNDPNDERSKVTLTELLAFKSGFNGDAVGLNAPACVSNETMTLENCVKELYENNFAYTPGTTYYYGPVHLQIAGAMAEKAVGKLWVDVAQDYLFSPLQMENVKFTSATNPRVAGGAQWSAAAAQKFAEAMLAMNVTLPNTYQAMVTDETPSIVANSPAVNWHYGLGVWRICTNLQSWVPSCEPVRKLGSIGLFGFYVWIDLDLQYYAVLSTQKLAQGSTISATLGYQLFDIIDNALMYRNLPQTSSATSLTTKDVTTLDPTSTATTQSSGARVTSFSLVVLGFIGLFLLG